MPVSLFTITTGTNTVVLNKQRMGEAAFTVTNVSGRPVRGRGELAPLGQTVAGWLSIEDEAERNFATGATQQYVVQVIVPPEAAEGDYTFRLDEVGVDNTDENYTQGPVVTFHVAPQEKPQPPKPFPWWIVAAAAAVIVVLGIIVFVLTRPGDFGGTWQTNIAQLVLTQNGTAVSGNLNFYGNPNSYPVQGTINGRTLTGFLSGYGIPFTLTVPLFGGRIEGFYTIDRAPWCGVRSGALPAGCGFSGHWNLAGDGQKSGAFADLVQTGPTMSGTFYNGTLHGQVLGTWISWQEDGQWTDEAGGTGSFLWQLMWPKYDQFEGNRGQGLAWCGFRNGSAVPIPCLGGVYAAPSPSLIP